jgi:predicted ribosome-associated RNA-binding protein Tma20
MRRILQKTLGSAIAMLFFVSSLAVATEMTCTKDDGKGTCIAATDPDGNTVIVVGEGLKTGEQMACEDRGTMIACQPLALASEPLVPFEMTCAKDDGKGTCIAATDANNDTVVVVGEGAKTGEKMSCVDRGNMIACQAL